MWCGNDEDSVESERDVAASEGFGYLEGEATSEPLELENGSEACVDCVDCVDYLGGRVSTMREHYRLESFVGHTSSLNLVGEDWYGC